MSPDVVEGFQIQDINDPEWASLFSTASDIVQSRILAELNELAGPNFDAIINVWRSKNFVTPSDFDAIKKRGFETINTRQSGQLVVPVHREPSYLSAMISSRILNASIASIQGRQVDLNAFQQDLENMALQIQDTQQEQNAVADELASDQNEANDPARSPEERARAAVLAAELQKELDAKVAQEQKEIENPETLDNENQQMQDLQDQSQTELDASEQAAEAARKRAFEGD